MSAINVRKQLSHRLQLWSTHPGISTKYIREVGAIFPDSNTPCNLEKKTFEEDTMPVKQIHHSGRNPFLNNTI